MFYLNIKRKIVLLGLIGLLSTLLLSVYVYEMQKKIISISKIQENINYFRERALDVKSSIFETRAARTTLINDILANNTINSKILGNFQDKRNTTTKLISDLVKLKPGLRDSKNINLDSIDKTSELWLMINQNCYPKFLDIIEKKLSTTEINNDIFKISVGITSAITTLCDEVSKEYYFLGDQIKGLNEDLNRNLIILSLALLAFLSPFTFFLVNSIIQPLTKMIRASEELATGNYSIDFEGNDRNDEISNVIKALNQSIQTVRLTLKQVMQSTELVNSGK